MADRVILFIDAQNVYRGARAAFFRDVPATPITKGYRFPHPHGQLDPIALGNLICSRPPPGHSRVLHEVRIYTGRPESSKQPKPYGANLRQCAAWEKAGARVIARTLRYPPDWPATKEEEKGIDVALAVDFVADAIEGSYDVGVICSTDTDLRPALEYVTHKFATYPRGEVLAWASPTARKPIFIHASRSIWCHYLDEADYHVVEDLTDYNIAS